MNKKNIFSYIIILLLIVSCSSGEIPKGIIPPEQMGKILWQLAIADQLINSDTAHAVRLHLKDSTTFLYQRILKDNKTDITKYKKSLSFYQTKPALMKLVIDTAFDYGSKVKDSFQKHYKPKPLLNQKGKADTSANEIHPHTILPVNKKFYSGRKLKLVN